LKISTFGSDFEFSLKCGYEGNKLEGKKWNGRKSNVMMIVK
jgi:hypothetical protein